MREQGKARVHGRQFHGVFSGVVEDIVDPDKEGRIKVSFPWFDDGTVSEWCRVAQLYAGPGFGTFFVPEAGTEVAVGFAQGNMREPIILGGLYNRKHKPATDRQRDEQKDEKQIRTRGGHRVTLDDTSEKQKIVIETTAGHRLELVDPGKDPARVRLESKRGHEVLLDDASGRIEITTSGGQRILLDEQGKIVIEADTIELGGAGFKAVLGEALRDLFNSHTHPVGGGNTGTPTQTMGGTQLSSTVRLE